MRKQTHEACADKLKTKMQAGRDKAKEKRAQKLSDPEVNTEQPGPSNPPGGVSSASTNRGAAGGGRKRRRAE